MGAYLELLRLPGASRAVVPAAAARLAMAVTPLAILMMLASSGRSLAVAGGASAAYALGLAVAAPISGRLVERWRPRVVLSTAVPAAILLVCLALVPNAREMVLYVLAGLAGLLTPPVGATMRAAWHGLTPDRDLRQRSYAFEAILTETLFIVGPALVTVLTTAVGGSIQLAVVSGMLAVGAVLFSSSSAVALNVATPHQTSAPVAPIATAALLVAIGLTAALSAAVAVAVVATLRLVGAAEALAGALITVQAVGSVCGGMVYGRTVRRGRTTIRYVRLLAILAFALAMLPAVLWIDTTGATIIGLALLLFVSGVPIASTGAEEFQLMGEITPASRMTSGFAGVGSCIAVGGAVGSAVGGLASEHWGAGAALSLPAVLTAVALIVMLAARPILERATFQCAIAEASALESTPLRNGESL